MKGGIEEMARQIVTGIETPRGSKTKSKTTFTTAVHAAGTTVAKAVTEDLTTNAVTGSQNTEMTWKTDTDVTGVIAVMKIINGTVTTVGVVTALLARTTRNHGQVGRHHRTGSGLLVEV